MVGLQPLVVVVPLMFVLHPNVFDLALWLEFASSALVGIAAVALATDSKSVAAYQVRVPQPQHQVGNHFSKVVPRPECLSLDW
jgi:hypothetical protein